MKKRCITCKKILIVPSWKTCQDCDPHKIKAMKKQKRENMKEIRRLVIEDFKDVIKLFKIDESLRKKPLHKKNVLLYDENNNIIGYK